MGEDIDTKILNLLASCEGFFPEPMIARKFKVSRVAISKRIQALRAWGCRIDFSPGRGYHLISVPDRLDPLFISMGLKTTVIGRRIFFYSTIDSTNTQAKKLAAEGVGDGTIVIADHQTQGKGRLKRQWISPPRKNILMSVIFYPLVSPSKVFLMTLFSSLAVCKCLRALFDIKAGIKWPNDVYVNNRKICGILTEVSSDQKRVKWVVVGIGLNVNVDLSQDSELCHIATSVKQEIRKSQKRLPLLRKILEEIDMLYKRFLTGEIQALRNEWLLYSIIIGEKVNIFSDGGKETGIAETVDDDGALILLTPDGERKKIVAGDVSLRIQNPGVRKQKKEERKQNESSLS